MNEIDIPTVLESSVVQIESSLLFFPALHEIDRQAAGLDILYFTEDFMIEAETDHKETENCVWNYLVQGGCLDRW